MDLLGWAEERVVDAMGKLMREGIVWWVLTSAAVRSRPPLLSLSLSHSRCALRSFARLDVPDDGTPLLYWCPSMGAV